MHSFIVAHARLLHLHFKPGEESYDNMWQKSRSIWKYIAKHYLHSFDYFLLGGDDMFYVIENLRAYLNSQEIQNLRNERNGSLNFSEKHKYKM